MSFKNWICYLSFPQDVLKTKLMQLRFKVHPKVLKNLHLLTRRQLVLSVRDWDLQEVDFPSAKEIVTFIPWLVFVLYFSLFISSYGLEWAGHPVGHIQPD